MRVSFDRNRTGCVRTQREPDPKMMVVCIKIQPANGAVWVIPQTIRMRVIKTALSVRRQASPPITERCLDIHRERRRHEWHNHR